MLRSKWMIVLVGQGDTGKTTLQKELVKLITYENRDDRLPSNRVFTVTKPELVERFKTFMPSNRSVQERPDYHGIEGYFRDHFADADLAVVSTHLKPKDIEEILREGHRRFYNVIGLFLSNAIAGARELAATISELPWDERLIAVNDDAAHWETSIASIAKELVAFLVRRK